MITGVLREGMLKPLKQMHEERLLRDDTELTLLHLSLRYELAKKELIQLSKALRFKKLKPQQTMSMLQQEYIDKRLAIHIMERQLELH